MKILIIGHGRHGKGTVCEYLKPFGFTSCSSSFMAGKEYVYPEYLRGKYLSFEHAYEERGKDSDMRAFWASKISEYNSPDKTRLARKILESFDIYDGMRKLDEFVPCMLQKLFDVVIYVEAMDRVKYVDPTFDIPKKYATFIIDNNYSQASLKRKVQEIGMILCRAKSTI